MGAVKLDVADRLFSLWIRHRDNWTCQRCGTRYAPPTRALHCSHFQGRGKESTRFDPENATSLCYGDHRYLTSHPAEHFQWQLERLGPERLDALVARSNITVKKDRKAQALYWRQRLREDFGVKA